jgi:hypothetical protein
MHRVKLAALLIAMVFAIFAVAGGGMGVLEMAMVVAVLLFTGIGPFVFGVAIRLLWKTDAVPVIVPWAFGLVLGVLRLAAPGLGGLIAMDSTPLAVVLTIVLAAAFTELGIASGAAVARRRRDRKAIASEA